MKQRLTISQLLFFFLIIFSACSKTDLEKPTPNPVPGPNPTPAPVGQPGTIKFQAMIDLSGQPYHSSNLHAVVSITGVNGNEVIKEKILTLNLSNPVKTATIELPEGDYKLTGFRLVYGGVNTHFAAPFAGSDKAVGVQKPLKMDFKVLKNALTEIPVEVLRVLQGETPQQYGYPSSAFDNGQSDASPFLKIKIKAIMQIGSVTYDHIPASLRITTWNDKGEMTTTYGSLNAGVNEVQVLKSAAKFEFLVSKWGTNEAITIERQDIDENTIYILGGSKEAKKLSSERVYKIVDGRDVADTKTDYFYDHTGKLIKIDYWTKKPDNSNYFSMADWFIYDADRLVKIKRINVSDNSTLKETLFTYNAQGKMTNMVEKANGFETAGAITYLPAQQKIGIHYNLASGHTLNYNMDFDKGNVIFSTAANSNSSFEQGRYSYDTNINPYHHMNWPTLFMEHSSKNNVTSQQKQFNGSYPTVTPYSFMYKYDADGYPVEVIKNYMSYPSGNFAFSTKTVFVY